jgi:DNA topoisomerase-2
MEYMDRDIVALMTKRAYDMAGVTDAKVKIFLNGERINVKNFDEYCDMYLKIDENKELPKIIESKHDRW